MMDRRRLLHWCSNALSCLVAGFVAIPAVRFLIDPLTHHSKRGRRRRLVLLSDLQVDEPRKVVITDQRVDAWTRYPEGPIGAVWLIRRDQTRVEAFSAICPHLGCPVNYVAADTVFFCPCHEARYSVSDGAVSAGPSQRGLDPLNVTIEKVGDQDWVSVVFQRFELGVAERIPLA